MGSVKPDTLTTSSLWLIPRDNHPFTNTYQELITDTVPRNFSHKLPKNNFIPHVTITSDIDPEKAYGASGKSAQEWLDSLQLPEFKKEKDEVVLELDHLTAGDAFYRKMVIEISPNENLKKLAARCRRDAVLSYSEDAKDADSNKDEAAQKWAQNQYQPHMSLFYNDLDTKEVKNKIPLVEIQIGFGLGSLFACCGGSLCMGGQLVLVDTSQPLEEWKVIATRDTPWVNWRMSHNLA